MVDFLLQFPLFSWNNLPRDDITQLTVRKPCKHCIAFSSLLEMISSVHSPRPNWDPNRDQRFSVECLSHYAAAQAVKGLLNFITYWWCTNPSLIFLYLLYGPIKTNQQIKSNEPICLHLTSQNRKKRMSPDTRISFALFDRKRKILRFVLFKSRQSTWVVSLLSKTAYE